MCNKVMNIADSHCCHDNEFIQRENGTRNVVKLFRIWQVKMLSIFMLLSYTIKFNRRFVMYYVVSCNMQLHFIMLSVII